MVQRIYPALPVQGDTGHAQYHADHTTDTQNHKASPHPQNLKDLLDVAVNGTPPPSNSLVVLAYDSINGGWDWVALPDDTIDFVNSEGQTFTRSKLLINTGTGTFADNPSLGRAELNLLPQNIKTLRVANSVTCTNVAGQTFTNIPDLSFTIQPGQTFDFDLYLIGQSTKGAGLKVLIQSPGATSMTYTPWGPYSTITDADNVTMRYPTIVIPTSGAQQFGGFPGAVGTLGPTTVRATGSVSVASGQPASTFVVKFNQITATTDVTSILPTHSKLTYRQAS